MASIEIFIGAPIEHASERATLQRADLVIAIDRAALVTESKGFTSAVRGGPNGDWQMRLASGVWKKVNNPYLQAMGEKLALRDAMRSFAGTDVPYPNAALIFVPAIPTGSTIPPGDFKVSIGGLDDLPRLVTSTKRDGWSLDRWRAFAAHHRLVSAPSIDEAMSPELLDAGKLLRSTVKPSSEPTVDLRLTWFPCLASTKARRFRRMAFWSGLRKTTTSC